MSWLDIADLKDRRLDPFRELKQRRVAGAAVVVEGEIAVRRALESRHRVETVAGTDRHLRRLHDVLDQADHVLCLPNAALREVTGFDFHRGCLAAVRRPAQRSEPDRAWLDRVQRAGRSTTLVAAGLADPANLGAVVRTARALGVDLVVADAAGADVYSRRSVRTSMGHVFATTVVISKGLEAILAHLRTGLPGLEVWAATTDRRAIDLAKTSRPDHLVVIVGNEGEGLPPETIALADAEVGISMVGGVDSLGVVAATAVILWALR